MPAPNLLTLVFHKLYETFLSCTVKFKAVIFTTEGSDPNVHQQMTGKTEGVLDIQENPIKLAMCQNLLAKAVTGMCLEETTPRVRARLKR